MAIAPSPSIPSVGIGHEIDDIDDEMFGVFDDEDENSLSILDARDKVMKAYKELIEKGDFSRFCKEAATHKKTLEGRISFEHDLQNGLLQAKTEGDFSILRKIALIEMMFRPDSFLGRIVQAMDYLRIGNTLSAFSLLNRKTKVLNHEMANEIVIQYQFCKRKNPLTSSHLFHLVEFFSQHNHLRDDPDAPHYLKI